MNRFVIALAVVGLAFTSCQRSQPETLGYQIISTRPHDATAYTQGLQLAGGRLFESTGQYGQSTVRELAPATGDILRKRPLAKTVFGEGLTLIGDELWILTWKEKTAYVLERDTFKPIRTHTYQGEGWAFTSNGDSLIMSNGSSAIVYRDPKTFAITRTITVTDHDVPVSKINELEWVKGEIYANVWESNQIVRIDPATGKVLGWTRQSA